MKIAIHAADLDHDRVDGTRVYILNMLKNFGKLDEKNSFYIYHKDEFNSKLVPPVFKNYFIKKIPFPKFWTQLRFAIEIFRDNPDVLWMPMHNIPIFRRKKLKVVVTIHDLAFKIFPQYFPEKDLKKLNRLSDYAIENADRIIAVSNSTKKDILKFYPKISSEKISVVHHGYDKELFEKEFSQTETEKILSIYKLKTKSYILYVGAIQPRKNLEILIDAFEKIKESNKDLKLVLAGAPAWKYEKTFEKINSSKFKSEIIVTGTTTFDHQPVLYRNSLAFVFPSLYEGFGIPVLEAFASGVPAIIANNSSLIEVGGDAALYFDTMSRSDLSDKINSIITNTNLRNSLIEKGRVRLEEFSWEKCAKLTLDNILK